MTSSLQPGRMHRNVGGLSVNKATWMQKDKIQVLEAKPLPGYSVYFLLSETCRPAVILAPNTENQEAVRQEKIERAHFRNYTKGFSAPIHGDAVYTGSYHRALFLNSIWLELHAPQEDQVELGVKYIGNTEEMQMYYSNLRTHYLNSYGIEDRPGYQSIPAK